MIRRIPYLVVGTILVVAALSTGLPFLFYLVYLGVIVGVGSYLVTRQGLTDLEATRKSDVVRDTRTPKVPMTNVASTTASTAARDHHEVIASRPLDQVDERGLVALGGAIFFGEKHVVQRVVGSIVVVTGVALLALG